METSILFPESKIKGETKTIIIIHFNRATRYDDVKQTNICFLGTSCFCGKYMPWSAKPGCKSVWYVVLSSLSENLIGSSNANVAGGEMDRQTFLSQKTEGS